MDNAPAVGRTIIDELSAKLVIDLRDYPNDSLEELMNKDYAVVKHTDTKGNVTHT